MPLDLRVFVPTFTDDPPNFRVIVSAWHTALPFAALGASPLNASGSSALLDGDASTGTFCDATGIVLKDGGWTVYPELLTSKTFGVFVGVKITAPADQALTYSAFEFDTQGSYASSGNYLSAFNMSFSRHTLLYVSADGSTWVAASGLGTTFLDGVQLPQSAADLFLPYGVSGAGTSTFRLVPNTVGGLVISPGQSVYLGILTYSGLSAYQKAYHPEGVDLRGSVKYGVNEIRLQVGPCSPPAAPLNVLTAPDPYTRSTLVRWDAVEGAQFYCIRRDGTVAHETRHLQWRDEWSAAAGTGGADPKTPPHIYSVCAVNECGEGAETFAAGAENA